jgi:hypothetical protein
MEFVFPALFSELKERHGSNAFKVSNSLMLFQVSAKNPLQGLDHRLKNLKINQLDDAFKIDSTILMQQHYFDLLYYTIE